jgi:arylformamidase
MLYDITRTVSPEIAVWPGDTPFSSKLVMAIAEGEAVNVSTLTMSAHTGTHVDALYHFTEDGLRVGQVSLEAFIGPARVVSVDKTGGLLPGDLADGALDGAERVLFHAPASDVPDGDYELIALPLKLADADGSPVRAVLRTLEG